MQVPVVEDEDVTRVEPVSFNTAIEGPKIKPKNFIKEGTKWSPIALRKIEGLVSNSRGNGLGSGGPGCPPLTWPPPIASVQRSHKIFSGREHLILRHLVRNNGRFMWQMPGLETLRGLYLVVTTNAMPQ
ncbi:hypothetical protein Nepgr_012375 [Nepenthes gracilis]|uniref:Uncharacterized protein n=1 Tax=Nepenthes gracilis TaxID=150966 RepID=A0AAD3SH67_NEPGR|nr:hypothetical protein Nepgr_012375 [Nepenthes gracilis]